MTEARARTIELVAFAAILVAAAVLRFVDLPTRGTWDADQGHDMLVLRDLVQRGVIPLLGPPTSIGDFHHGMLYYLLLAPAAAVSGVDPTAVTAWIALGGVVAVGVTGWLARSIGGPVAGVIAATLMAVSASAVEESTFIWNPNVIALSSSIALAAAWHAWRARRPRWWIVAGAAAVVTMHCHVLGVTLTPVVAALLVADVRRRRGAGDRAGARAVLVAAGWWIALLIVSYVPLAIHEWTSDASELRAAIAFLTGGGTASVALPARVPIVGLRVLGWPLAGLITAAPVESVLVSTLVVVVAAWRGWLVPPSDERNAIRWLALGLLWTVVALAVGASSLATVVLGLPNDHYHAFADPIVFVLVGVGIAALVQGANGWSPSPDDRPTTVPAPVRMAGVGLGAVVLIGLVGWDVVRQPPAVAADGGWPAAQVAAARILVSTEGTRTGWLVLDSLPAIKPADAVRFPLERLDPGAVVDPTTPVRYDRDMVSLVVLCDQLFHETIGSDCGGPAEDAFASSIFGEPVLPGFVVLRFEAAPGRWISVYRLHATP